MKSLKKKIQKQKVIITGAGGFLGGYVKKSLRKSFKLKFLKMRNLINQNKKKRKEAIKSCFKGKPVACIHLATYYGSNPLKAKKYNEKIPLEIVREATKMKVPLFLNGSSFFTKRKNYYTPHRIYINSKINFIKKAKMMATKKQLKFINLILYHIYGCHDRKTKFIPYIISKILKSHDVQLTKCTQKRDFIYAADAASAIKDILNSEIKRRKGEYAEYEIGSGTLISVKNFVKKIKKICRSKSNLQFGKIRTFKNEPSGLKANLKALQKLKWRPKTKLNEGLKITINSYGKK